MGRCCCCNKEIDVWHSNQLKDGEICDECYAVVHNADSSADKLRLSKSKCSDIKMIFEQNKNSFDDISKTSYCTQSNQQTYITAEPKENSRKESKGIFRRFIDLAELVILIVGLYLWLSGNYVIVGMDLIAYINEDNPTENPYIQMVCTSVPDGTTQNWGTVFSKTLPANRWSYFKNNGVRYVKVASKFQKEDTDTLETVFKLSPLEEKGTFWIEMSSMRYGGRKLSDLETSAVLATLYEGDLANLVADYILDSIF